ncbi:MAG: 50S ribosomal protein L11 methyltransferase, partial [Candidatus Poribacteria bacterium]|nr:50S ribosomal protein L11 methyltransferase [Candidatus Poribacteria bacterium]
TDWTEEWRSAFPPQKIGNRIIVAPTWVKIVPEPSDVLVRLDPGMAFGTGHHPTTRLSIRLLEKTIKGNEIVADIGTGSGILSISAAKLGAVRIDAVDLDESTLPVAAGNLKQNDVESVVRLQAGNGLDSCSGKYDVIVANILTKVLLPMIPELPQSLNLDGKVILSGITAQEAAQVVKTLNMHQLFPVDIERDEEWVAILARMGEQSFEPNA